MEKFSNREIKEIALFFRAINQTVKEQPDTPLLLRHETSTLRLDLTITKFKESN